MHIEESGRLAGPPVVLLHGLPSTVDWAEALVRRLEPTHRVLIPHLPGYGLSPPVTPYGWSAVMSDLAGELKQRVGSTPAVLVGFSGGAWRALELAADGLVPARAILALGAVAHLDDAERAGFRQFAAALRAGADLSALAGPRFLAKLAHDAAAVSQVQAWLRAASPAALADELEALAGEPDVLSRLSHVKCPVTLRTGTADVACPPAKARAIAAAIPHAQLEWVEGAGHALNLEAPDALDISGL